MSERISRSEQEAIAFQALDSVRSIEGFYSCVPKNPNSPSETVPLIPVYAGLNGSLEPTPHKESGYLTVQKSIYDESRDHYCVKIVGEHEIPYETLEVIVHRETRQPDFVISKYNDTADSMFVIDIMRETLKHHFPESTK